MTSCAIDPYGQISICVLSHQESYDWRSGSFSAGLGRFSAAACAAKKKTRQTKCDSCRIHSLCGMCAANGELEKGDAESPVEFLCEVAHLRAMALGVEIPAHGDCECCEGGASHAKLARSAERIRKGEVNVGSWTPTPPIAVTAGAAAELRLRQRLRFLRSPCMRSEVATMTEQNQNPRKDAKPYEAPKIIRVSLRPEEAVLGHCKTPSIGVARQPAVAAWPSADAVRSVPDEIRCDALTTTSEELRSTRPRRRRIAARIGGISLGATSTAGGPLLAADAEFSRFLVRGPGVRYGIHSRVRRAIGCGSRANWCFDSRGLWKLFRQFGRLLFSI